MPIKGYNKQASYEYDARRFSSPQGRLFAELEMRELCKVTDQMPKPKRVLELGCGTGRFMQVLLANGHEVYGLDPSPYMIELAREKTSEYVTARYLMGEGAAIPFPDGAFDLIYSIRTINQTPSTKYAMKMIEEAIRVCRPQGQILLEFVNGQAMLSLKRNPCVLLSLGDLERLLKCHPTVHVARLSGILFIPQTILNILPPSLLGLFRAVDNILSGCLPQFCTRCYVLLELYAVEGS